MVQEAPSQRWFDFSPISIKKQGEKAGENIAKGMGIGTKNTKDTREAMNKHVREAQSAWGIRSPSRVAMRKIGKPIAEGIIEGIRDGNIPPAFRGVLEKAKDALKRVRGFLQTGRDAAWGFVKGLRRGHTRQHEEDSRFRCQRDQEVRALSLAAHYRTRPRCRTRLRHRSCQEHKLRSARLRAR